MGSYVPPGMNPRRAGTIADLILRRGDIGAQRAMSSGDVWGRALSQLGQQIGGFLQQKQERKEAGKRSEALMSLASSPVWGEDPQQGFAQAVSILGPRDGSAFAKGIMATAEVAQQPDPGVAQKNMPVIAQGWLAATPETRAGIYPMLRQTMVNAQLGTEEDWPQEWSEELLPQVQAMVSSYAPEDEGPKVGSDEWLLSAKPEEIESLKAQRAAVAPERGATTSGTATERFMAMNPEDQKALIEAERRLAAAGRAPKEAPDVATVDAYVSDLKQGHAIWSDVPRNMRNAVKKAASQEGVTAPTRRVSEKKLDELQDSLDLIDRTADIQDLESGFVARIQGQAVPEWFKELTSWDRAQRLGAEEAAYFMYAAETLKKMQGSRPSDRDMQWYLQNLPRQGDAPGTKAYKVERIKERLVKRYNREVRDLKNNGFALRGYSEVPTEEAQQAEAETIDLGIPGVSVRVRAK